MKAKQSVNQTRRTPLLWRSGKLNFSGCAAIKKEHRELFPVFPDRFDHEYSEVN